MKANEQIDAFKFLLVPRVVACVFVLPLLTLFMDFSGLMGGFGMQEAMRYLMEAAAGSLMACVSTDELAQKSLEHTFAVTLVPAGVIVCAELTNPDPRL